MKAELKQNVSCRISMGAGLNGSGIISRCQHHRNNSVHKDVEVRIIDSAEGPMVIVHLLVDTLDAMGANAVNTMAET